MYILEYFNKLCTVTLGLIRLVMFLQPFVCYDTEDNSRELLSAGKSGFLKRVTQIAALSSDGRRFHNRGNVSEFLSWLNAFAAPLEFPLQVYAFNSQYDLGNLFSKALDHCDVTLLGNRLIKAVWGKVHFLDVANLWMGCNVKQLGKAFDLEKLDFDSESEAYVFRDVEIIMAAMRFIKTLALEHDIDPLPNTIGGTSVAVWKADGGENWHCGEPFARESLYGGRVELFRTGAVGDLWYTDINSLYPYCLTLPYPDSYEELKDLTPFCCAKVKLQVPQDFIAPLPVRRDDDSIYYPCGTISGIWTGAEILNAIKHGAKVLKLYDCFGSQTGSYYYRDFVLRYHALKQAAPSKAHREMYKRFLNSFYGQLGIEGGIFRSMKLERALHKEGHAYGSKKLVKTTMPLPTHVNYLHCAYITSYSRLRLQEFLRSCEPSQLVYCDTDSIFLEGKPRFPIEDELGGMKVEKHLPHGVCRIIAPKCYEFGADKKAKGVRRDLAELFIATGSASYDIPYRIREAIQYYDAGNSRQLSVWRKVTKQLRTIYDKKVLTGDSYSPIFLNALGQPVNTNQYGTKKQSRENGKGSKQGSFPRSSPRRRKQHPQRGKSASASPHCSRSPN